MLSGARGQEEIGGREGERGNDTDRADRGRNIRRESKNEGERGRGVVVERGVWEEVLTFRKT